jgi:hypothetical protein
MNQNRRHIEGLGITRHDQLRCKIATFTGVRRFAKVGVYYKLVRSNDLAKPVEYLAAHQCLLLEQKKIPQRRWGIDSKPGEPRLA